MSIIGRRVNGWRRLLRAPTATRLVGNFEQVLTRALADGVAALLWPSAAEGRRLGVRRRELDEGAPTERSPRARNVG